MRKTREAVDAARRLTLTEYPGAGLLGFAADELAATPKGRLELVVLNRVRGPHVVAEVGTDLIDRLAIDQRGPLPSGAVADISTTLRTIAADVYPVFSALVASGSAPPVAPLIAVSAAATRHADATEFIEAVLVDPELGRVFEYQGDGSITDRSARHALTVSRTSYLTTGGAKGEQVEVFSAQLLETAARRCLVADDT